MIWVFRIFVHLSELSKNMSNQEIETNNSIVAISLYDGKTLIENQTKRNFRDVINGVF